MSVKLMVLGTPAPKGSARAVPLPNGRAVLVQGSSDVGKKKLQNWSSAVREVAQLAAQGRTGPIYVGVPIFVSIVFKMARPSGHWSKKGGGGLLPSAPKHPTVKPDKDKLERATLDAMKGSIYDDDSKIVASVSAKIYAAPGTEGASIIVTEVTPEILRHLGVPTT